MPQTPHLPGTAESVWTIVVAGGSGQRFGGAKQYELIGGRRMLDVAVGVARSASDGVVVVVPPADAIREAAVSGGTTRSASVRAGLAAVPRTATVICVHDAARPFATDSLFAAVIDAVHRGADGAVPGIGVTDTIKRVDGNGSVLRTPPRDELVAAQTPQAFRAAVLRAAHAGGADASDDAALVEAAGGTVVVVAGEPDNRKITTTADLRWATAPQHSAPANLRVGQGFDVHRFSTDAHRSLVLGGVTFPGERGLEGHSDADVVTHAVADSLLGAAGLGDIGEHFPDTDERWRDANSLMLLEHVVALVRAAGWSIGNVDCAVVCEVPKLAPHRAEMQARLSQAVGADVTVKGRRAEGLGAIGRREGIACWTVAVISRHDVSRQGSDN